jgi:Protein of unknown function (DUF4199)
MQNRGLIKMKIKSPLLRLALRNGTIAAIIAFSLLIVLYVSGKHPFLIAVYADFRIFLFGVFIFFTLKEYRDQYKQGVLYFWQGMMTSYAFIAVFSVVAALGVIILSEVYPPFIAEYVRLFTEQAHAGAAEAVQQMGEENFERNLQALQATNGYERALVYSLQSVWIGFFISIIISILLRKQPKP